MTPTIRSDIQGRQHVFSENLLELFSGAYTLIYVKRVQPAGTKNQEHDALLKYWQEAIGEYVKTKREALDMSQEEVLGRSRRTTVSEIEQGISNFELDTLITILAKVGGDPSEAFGGKAPREFRGPHRRLFDLLAELVEDGNERALEYVHLQLEAAHERYVLKKRQRV